jgi:hypothetical protein
VIETPENDIRYQQPRPAPRQAVPVSLGALGASAVAWLLLAILAPSILLWAVVAVTGLWHAAPVALIGVPLIVLALRRIAVE